MLLAATRDSTKVTVRTNGKEVLLANRLYCSFAVKIEILASGILLSLPAVIILLSAIMEPLVAFARVSSALPNNSLALSLCNAKYKEEKKFQKMIGTQSTRIR